MIKSKLKLLSKNLHEIKTKGIVKSIIRIDGKIIFSSGKDINRINTKNFLEILYKKREEKTEKNPKFQTKTEKTKKNPRIPNKNRKTGKIPNKNRNFKIAHKNNKQTNNQPSPKPLNFMQRRLHNKNLGPKNPKTSKNANKALKANNNPLNKKAKPDFLRFKHSEKMGFIELLRNSGIFHRKQNHRFGIFWGNYGFGKK